MQHKTGCLHLRPLEGGKLKTRFEFKLFSPTFANRPVCQNTRYWTLDIGLCISLLYLSCIYDNFNDYLNL